MLRLMEHGGWGGFLVNNSLMCYFYYYLLWPRNRKWFLMSPALPDDGPSPFGYLRDGESEIGRSDWTLLVAHRMHRFFCYDLVFGMLCTSSTLSDGHVLQVAHTNWCPCGAFFFVVVVKTVPRSKSDAEVDSGGRSMPVPTRSSSLKPSAKR